MTWAQIELTCYMTPAFCHLHSILPILSRYHSLWRKYDTSKKCTGWFMTKTEHIYAEIPLECKLYQMFHTPDHFLWCVQMSSYIFSSGQVIPTKKDIYSTALSTSFCKKNIFQKKTLIQGIWTSKIFHHY